jgi:hypothetical protein
VRDAKEGLAADGAIPEQLPDRLHVPDVREKFLRQVPWTTLGGGYSGGFAPMGATPERAATARNTVVQIACNLKAIIAVVVPIYDAACDLAPDAESRRSVCQSGRRGGARRVAVREIQADGLILLRKEGVEEENGQRLEDEEKEWKFKIETILENFNETANSMVTKVLPKHRPLSCKRIFWFRKWFTRILVAPWKDRLIPCRWCELHAGPIFVTLRISNGFFLQKATHRASIEKDLNISPLLGYEASGDLTSQGHCAYPAGVL